MDRAEARGARHRVDTDGAKMGMWIFLFTEVLFFGGLFLLYSVYRARYASDFQAAAAELDMVLGTANTVILLTSSLSIALSIAMIRKGREKVSIVCQAVTIVLGVVFLINKYVEWSAHISRGIYPDSPVLLAMGGGKTIFFGLYYVMTGLHGLHVLIGVAVISGMALMTARRTITPGDYVKLENGGLYWHFVDIVWIYLFPLFYLIT